MNARSRALLEELRSLPVEEREAVVAELYEGTASELSDAGDDLDDEERERLHRSIARGLEDVAAGRTVDARSVVEALRARAAGR